MTKEPSFQKFLDVLDAYKAQDVVFLPAQPGMFDIDLLVATCTSNRHIATLEQFLAKAAKAEGLKPRISERSESGWQVVDLGALMIHLFLDEKRKQYDLETLRRESPKQKTLEHTGEP